MVAESDHVLDMVLYFGVPYPLQVISDCPVEVLDVWLIHM